MLGYVTVESNYRINFLLLQHHKYSMSDIDNMIPFERDLYLDQLQKHIEEQNRMLEENGKK